MFLFFECFSSESGRESVREPKYSTTSKIIEDVSNLEEGYAHFDENYDDEFDLKPKLRTKQRNDLIGTPSDVALLRYVQQVASVQGVRNRFQV